MKNMYFLGPKAKMPFTMEHPQLHTKPSLLKCRSVQRSKILKQNQIISICSRVIAFLPIWAPSFEGGAGGWGVSQYMGGHQMHAKIGACMHAHTC